jgi:hypothetical protein
MLLHARRMHQRRMEALRRRLPRRLVMWNVVGADFNVIDENIGIVDGGGQLIGKLHVAVHDELDMMCPGEEIELGREQSRVMEAAQQVRLFHMIMCKVNTTSRIARLDK